MTDVSPSERIISGLLHPLILSVFPPLDWRESIDFLLICLKESAILFLSFKFSSITR